MAKRSSSARHLLVLLGFLMAGSASAAQGTVASRIKQVTLFSNQALVVREASVQVQEGLNEILLEVDAFRVDTDSVTARVFGDGELYSVQLKDVFATEAPQDNIRSLEEKLRELRASLQALEDGGAVLKEKTRFVAAVVDFAGTQVPREIKTSFPKIEDLEGTVAFVGRSLEQIHRQRQSLDEKIFSTKGEIEAVEKELAALTGRRQREGKAVEVLFHADKPQSIRIEAVYLVQGAFWQPLYKAAVPLDLGQVQLTMFSKIVQKTGEDWRDVDLSVSSVVPLKGAGLPDLTSWILDIVRPEARDTMGGRVQLRTAAPAAAVKEKEAMRMANEPRGEQEAAFVSAERKELPLSFEYRMPRKLSVESRDKVTVLPLFTRSFSGDFHHYAVPRRTPQVFLVCKATVDKELLAGPMNVHFGPHFVGKSFLEEKKPGGGFELNLGADREVKVTREKVTDKIKETFFGKFERGTVVRQMAFKIGIENLKAKPITIRILENVPVSRTDRIKVEELKMVPEPAETNYQDREGVHLWTLDLQPRQAREITLSFVVSYPKDEPVMGL